MHVCRCVCHREDGRARRRPPPPPRGVEVARACAGISPRLDGARAYAALGSTDDSVARARQTAAQRQCNRALDPDGTGGDCAAEEEEPCHGSVGRAGEHGWRAPINRAAVWRVPLDRQRRLMSECQSRYRRAESDCGGRQRHVPRGAVGRTEHAGWRDDGRSRQRRADEQQHQARARRWTGVVLHHHSSFTRTFQTPSFGSK